MSNQLPPIRTLHAEEAIILARILGANTERGLDMVAIRQLCAPTPVDEAIDFLKEHKLLVEPDNKRTGRPDRGVLKPAVFAQEVLERDLEDITIECETRIEQCRVKPERIRLEAIMKELNSTQESTHGSGTATEPEKRITPPRNRPVVAVKPPVKPAGKPPARPAAKPAAAPPGSPASRRQPQGRAAQAGRRNSA